MGFAALAVPAKPLAPRYSVTDLGTLGGSTSQARGLNDIGQIAGLSDLAGDHGFHPFVYEQGVMTDLGVLDGFSTGQAFAINEHGQMAGTVYNSSGTQVRAFLYDQGNMQNLGLLGGRMDGQSYGWAINDSAQVVGDSLFRPSRHGERARFRPFRFSDDFMQNLGALGGRGTSSVASGINDQGEVVGSSDIDEAGHDYHAFVWTVGIGMVDLHEAMGAADCCSHADDINNLGDIVGRTHFPTVPAWRAFLFHDGVAINLGVLDGFVSSEALAINDAGEIIGFSFDDDGRSESFVYANGVMYPLKDALPPGWSAIAVGAVNSFGEIAGSGVFAGGARHAVLLRPETISVSPSTVGVVVGTRRSGDVGDIAVDDDAYFEVDAADQPALTTAGARLTDWAGTFSAIPNEVIALDLRYKGKNSSACRQTVSVWNWENSEWADLDTQTVGTSEIEVRRAPKGALQDYVSGTTGMGELKLRVRCQRDDATAFFSSGDLMEVRYH
jgi:probable HAF family extracellular repeat protein